MASPASQALVVGFKDNNRPKVLDLRISKVSLVYQWTWLFEGSLFSFLFSLRLWPLFYRDNHGSCSILSLAISYTYSLLSSNDPIDPVAEEGNNEKYWGVILMETYCAKKQIVSGKIVWFLGLSWVGLG